MIRLSNENKVKLKEKIFYFHTMEECTEFMNIFKENSCDVNWKEPREIPDTVKLKNMDIVDMEKPVKERAEKALVWGFNITSSNSFFTG